MIDPDIAAMDKPVGFPGTDDEWEEHKSLSPAEKVGWLNQRYKEQEREAHRIFTAVRYQTVADVIPTLYDMTLEEALAIPVRIPTAERKTMRWLMCDTTKGDQTGMLLQDIGESTSCNYTTVESTALEKGLSAFQHRFGNGGYELTSMRRDAMQNNNSEYYRRKGNRCIDLNLPPNVRKIYTTGETQATITQYTLLLNITLQKFTSILVMYALVDSEIIPGHLKKTFQDYIDTFEISVRELFEAMGISIDAPTEPES